MRILYNRLLTIILILSLILVQNNLLVYSYNVSSTILVVNLDGSVEVSQIITGFNPGENITIKLIGEPFYIEATSSGIPQPISINSSTVTIIAPIGEEIKLKYLTYEITNKTGVEWTLSYTSEWPTSVIFPEEAVILEVTPEDFDVDIVNNSVAMVFSPGDVTITYVIIPVKGGEPEGPTGPPLKLDENFPLYITIILLLGLGSYILYKKMRGRSSIPIELTYLDERDEQILEVLSKEGELTARELMEKTGIPKTPLYRRLRRLVKQGYIKQRSVSGVTYYSLGERKK